MDLQNGNPRSGYATQQSANLRAHLEEKFGVQLNDFKISYIKKLFLFFPIPITPFNNQLTWSHYTEALKSDSQPEAEFYLQQAAQDNWSVRKLKQQMKNKLYYQVSITAHMLSSLEESNQAHAAIPARTNRVISRRSRDFGAST